MLGSQFVFNIGFYAVVPFLAIFLRDDMLLSGGVIGLILGLRTFSQQGMFLLGGALSDRYGAKIIILCGCLVRIAGYLLLALGQSLWPIILGACLTGIGGALFSPSMKRCWPKRNAKRGQARGRAEWFALFAVCGELGAVLGPAAGALLTGFGFRRGAGRGRGLCHRADGAVLFLSATGNSKQALKIVPGG